MVTDSPLMKPWTVTRLTSQYVMLHMGKGRRPQATVQGHERTSPQVQWEPWRVIRRSGPSSMLADAWDVWREGAGSRLGDGV